jgi:ADP-ribosyl-[dinitrogen reductase] hydrolase
MLCRALGGADKEAILLGGSLGRLESPSIQAIARGEYRRKPVEQIHGTGYVVQCLEAALWCFDRSNSYGQAVLQAANLGEDADTTAAVCGQIAGAYYGADGIPADWLDRLALRETIEALAEGLRGGPRAG